MKPKSKDLKKTVPDKNASLERVIQGKDLRGMVYF